MQQYKNLIINNNNLNCFFFDEFINTLNESVEYKVLNEKIFNFTEWMQTGGQGIWNFFKGLIVGKDQTGQAVWDKTSGANVDSMLSNYAKNKALIASKQNLTSGMGFFGNEVSKATKQITNAEKAGIQNASSGLASYLPEPIKNFIRDNGNLTTGIAISAGVLGLIYLYKKFLKNPNKPPDRQTIQYAQKLNNIKPNQLSQSQLNASISI